jgi:hypothetical protein
MYNTSRTPVNYGLRWTASKAMMFLSMTVMSASRSLAVTIMQVHPPSGKCETADDLAFDGCKIEHLGIPALKSICENVGLDVEVEVFPFLFIDSADSPSTRTFGQEDYAAAAYGCISAAEENEPEYNFDESFVDEVLQESPEILAQIVSGVMESNPWLIDEFLEELKRREPEVWRSVEEETENGKTNLLESPELVSALVKMLFENEPGLLSGAGWEDDYHEDYAFTNGSFEDYSLSNSM